MWDELDLQYNVINDSDTGVNEHVSSVRYDSRKLGTGSTTWRKTILLLEFTLSL